MLWLAILLTILFLLILIIIGVIFSKSTLSIGIIEPNMTWWKRIVNKGTTRRKRLKIFLFICLIGGVSLGLLNLSTRIAYYKPRNEIHGWGEWRTSGPQKYLYVEAEDRYSFGYLEGRYLSREINNFRASIISMGIAINKPYSEIIKEAYLYLSYIPDSYIEEMQGIADGASFASGWPINFGDILVQNTFLDLVYGRWYPSGVNLNVFLGCTNVGAKNANGSVVFGQNFDYPIELGKNGLFPSLAFVHSKLKGVAEIFGLRMGAIVSLPVGKTSNNIMMTVTVIESNILSNYSTPAVFLARQALEYATSIEELENMVFKNSYLTCSFTNLAYDGSHFVGVQAHTLGYRVREENMMVNTNRYIYNDWNELYFAVGNYSNPRQHYAERLLAEAYMPDQTLTHEELLQILATRKNGYEGDYSAPCYDDDGYGSATLAVFTINNFGIGQVRDGLGKNPL